MFKSIKNAYNATTSFIGRNVNKAAVAGTAMIASGHAMAQTADLGAAAETAISGAKDTVSSILLVLVGVAFLFVLYKLIVRAK